MQNDNLELAENVSSSVQSLRSIYLQNHTELKQKFTKSEELNLSTMFMTKLNISYKRAPIVLPGDTKAF